MSDFVFVLTRGLEDPTRVCRSLQLAKAAVENSHNASIFLTDDAVVIPQPGMLDNVVAPTGDEAASHFQFLLQNKVPVYV